MPRMIRFLGLLALLLFPGTPRAAQPAPKLAVFDMEFIDSTGADPTKADLAKVAQLSDQLRQALRKSGQYDVVDLTPLKSEMAKAPEIHACNGCERDFAKQAGAKLAMVGLVRRASERLFDITLVLENAATGKLIKTCTATVRSGEEASWYRGLKFLLDDRFLE